MIWAHFLHVYQPPTQKRAIVERVADESYRKVFSGLLKIKNAKLTLNINGVLCDTLDAYGGKDILETIQKLVKSGAVELTGSSKYHAFLPLLPETEIRRQILLNEATLTKYFGEGWKKGGFFAPEMAYSQKVFKVAYELGYRYFVVDEVAFPKNRKFQATSKYRIEGLNGSGNGAYAFFRDRGFSFAIASAHFGTLSETLHHLGPRLTTNEYVVTAMDGEIFGHHRPGLEQLLFDLLKEDKIHSVTLSELASKLTEEEIVVPRDSTWATTKRDIKENIPFARWFGSNNPVHAKQWELTNLAIKVIHRAEMHKASREALDHALHSDQYWWASARPWWSLEMIERGAHELKQAILKSPVARPAERRKAEELYYAILTTGFDWQRSGYVDELARWESDEVRERLDEKGKYFITQDEYKHMIKTLDDQIKIAVQNEQYYRAAMIRDRIKELKEEMARILPPNSPSDKPAAPVK